jgi:hypothetical protein
MVCPQSLPEQSIVYVESDLRIIFYVTGDLVISLDMGDHAIYRT